MNIADVMIHVHPDLSAEQRKTIEEKVSACNGVVSVHFSPQHAHEMTVAYDPEVINSQTILEQIRQWDTAATMIGL